MKKLLISFSGGRTSAFMCKLILEYPKYKDVEKLFLYANTGKELEKTLEFVDRVDKEYNLNLIWIEADVQPKKGDGTKYKIVDFKSASRNGEPFEALIKKYGLPSKYYKHCTRDLKEVPLHKYAKEILGKEYHTAIGIRADEKHRLTSDPKKVYPMSEMNIDEKIVRDFWERQDFDLEIHDYQGNCDLCFLKSLRKKLTLLQEDPKIGNWWDQMEIKYTTDKQSKFDAQRKLYVKDLQKISSKPFTKAKDKHELRKQQFDLEMDLEFDCFCKMN